MCRIFFVLHLECKNKTCQVFTFLLKTESWLWRKLDWSKVTVICYAGWVDEELTRFAHQKNVSGWSSHLPVPWLVISGNDKIKRLFSVVFIANFPKQQLLNTTYRNMWVDQQVDFALSNNLGILLILSFISKIKTQL